MSIIDVIKHGRFESRELTRNAWEFLHDDDLVVVECAVDIENINLMMQDAADLLTLLGKVRKRLLGHTEGDANEGG